MDIREKIRKLTNDKDEQIVIFKVMDKIKSSMEKNYINFTDFLSEREQAFIFALIKEKNMPNCFFWGGYEDASRKILVILPSYINKEDALKEFEEEDPLSYIRFTHIAGLRHGDFLGSILALGLKRVVVGDILVGEKSTDIIVKNEICEFLFMNYHKAGNKSISGERINSFKDLAVQTYSTEEKVITISSLRLDVYVSDVFKLSRVKSKELILQGKVSVNSMSVLKGDARINCLDKITLRGKGKTCFKEILGDTKKNKLRIVVEYYK